MTIEYTAFKGSSSGAIQEEKISHRDLQANEVFVKILYSGVCGTDEHYRHGHIALGHEGVGSVERVGSAVLGLEVNDRVGIGYVRGGCGSCEECILGYNFYCTRAPNNYGAKDSDADVATWATHAMLPALRLAKIPDSIPSEYAGPLMCAGQTVWLPFARTDIRPWHTVGIVGVGGLGHLAIQFASKMGCEVVVFSGSEGKRAEAIALGASEFYTGEDLKGEGMRRGFVDHLLVTTSQLPDWKVYLPVLANRAHIYPLTISMDDFAMNQLSMIQKEITVRVLCASTMTQINDMLKFAGRHKIRPIIESFSMTLKGINEAMEKLAAGKMRYRGVLKA